METIDEDMADYLELDDEELFTEFEREYEESDVKRQEKEEKEPQKAETTLMIFVPSPEKIKVEGRKNDEVMDSVDPREMFGSRRNSFCSEQKVELKRLGPYQGELYVTRRRFDEPYTPPSIPMISAPPPMISAPLPMISTPPPMISAPPPMIFARTHIPTPMSLFTSMSQEPLVEQMPTWKNKRRVRPKKKKIVTPNGFKIVKIYKNRTVSTWVETKNEAPVTQ